MHRHPELRRLNLLYALGVVVLDSATRTRLALMQAIMAWNGDITTTGIYPVTHVREACRHGIECIDVYRRGERVPKLPTRFLEEETFERLQGDRYRRL